ncbi:MAG TPA: hexose kinase [bacterium]|nr:hexose kinase [bacterium]
MRLITVTPNPMLDVTLDLPVLVRGGINRAETAAAVAGGKGINVARQAVLLGMPVLATGFLGGATGDKVATLVHSEQIPADFIRIEAETRSGWTLRESGGPATAVFAPPPLVTAADVAALTALVGRELQPGDWLAICGTLPAGCPATLYADLLTLARARNARTLLDAHGEELRLGLAALPTVAKPNRHEYEGTFGCRLHEPAGFHRALAALRQAGAGVAVITDGPNPWYAAAAEGAYRVMPPTVAEVNPIGSGDTLAAALIHALAAGAAFTAALTDAAAFAAANAARWPVAAVTPADAALLRAAVTCQPL